MDDEEKIICFAPDHLRLDIADLILFFEEPNDQDEAEEFLEKVLAECEKANLNVVGYPYNDLQLAAGEIESIENLCNVCVQKWFLVTDNFVVNKQMMLHKDEHLMNAVMRGESFLPVWIKPKDEFESLPYGLISYTGLYHDDSRMVKKLKRLFSSSQHQAKKQKLRDKQKKDLDDWVRLEKERRRLEHEIREEKFARRRQVIKDEVKEAIQNEGLGSMKCQLKVIEDLIRALPEEIIKAAAAAEQDDPEGIPVYLMRSLSLAQSSTGSPSNVTRHQPVQIGTPRQEGNVTYNITINQPGVINLGNNADDVQINETPMKGVEETTEEQPEEYRRGSPDNMSQNSSGSFEHVSVSP